MDVVCIVSATSHGMTMDTKGRRVELIIYETAGFKTYMTLLNTAVYDCMIFARRPVTDHED